MGAGRRCCLKTQHFPCNWLHKFPGSNTKRASSAPRTGLHRQEEGGCPGSPRLHSPVFAAQAVPSAWWTPAWNLTFSTTPQTCPGWRSGCACGSPSCPRDRSSLSPSHPRPSTSCPFLVGLAGPGGSPRPRQCSLLLALSFLLRCLCPVSCYWSPELRTAARRLRLRPRLAQLGLGLRAPPAPQTVSLCTPNCFLPATTAFPGVGAEGVGKWGCPRLEL